MRPGPQVAFCYEYAPEFSGKPAFVELQAVEGLAENGSGHIPERARNRHE